MRSIPLEYFGQFAIYGHLDGIPLAPVISFKYFRRFISAADNNWPTLVKNLQRARQKWARLTRVMIREGADDRTSDQIYLVVVQSVMLYGPETWRITPHIGRVWGGLRHRVTLRMTGRQPWKGRDGIWVYPPLEDPMVEVGLQEVDRYVSRHQNMAAKFISTSPIMGLCMAAEKRLGPIVSKWWC